MYDLSKRECVDKVTAGDVIDLLLKVPRSAQMVVCGAEKFYLHVDTNNTIVCLDTEDLDDDYFEARRIEFGNLTDIREVLKYNKGIKPRYAGKSSTLRGVVNCECNCCVGNLLYYIEIRKVVGWIDTMCSQCGSEIDWSESDRYL